MSKPMVYLETSFFRYLIATPSTDPRKADRQRITRDWWQDSRHKYDLCVSKTVFDEFCEIGDGKISPEEAAARLVLLQQAELLIQERAILEMAALLVVPRGPLPVKAGADALTLHVAAVGPRQMTDAIDRVRDTGAAVGLAFNPDTDPESCSN